jgi:predicted nucleotidyltransferase
MKKLEKKNLILGKRMGKAIFYKINLKDYYAFRIMETLLINEARGNASRWIFEFEELYKYVDIIIIFGSIIKNPKKANDIDLLIVFKKERNDIIKDIIKNKRLVLTRPIHLIKQLPRELITNLKRKDKVILEALKYGYVLHGYDKLLKSIKNVTSI